MRLIVMSGTDGNKGVAMQSIQRIRNEDGRATSLGVG